MKVIYVLDTGTPNARQSKIALCDERKFKETQRAAFAVRSPDADRVFDLLKKCYRQDQLVGLAENEVVVRESAELAAMYVNCCCSVKPILPGVKPFRYTVTINRHLTF